MIPPTEHCVLTLNIGRCSARDFLEYKYAEGYQNTSGFGTPINNTILLVIMRESFDKAVAGGGSWYSIQR